MRACQELGVKTVAVYSEADARAPHVREADEAVLIGPPPSTESYLRGDKIIEAAKITGAEGVHPGYGFLSEREWFARAVRDAGLVWIGPPAEAIAAMGSKTAARTLAVANGVPVVPGTTEPLADASEAEKLAKKFGYPVLLKAAAGGGGKGMRFVTEPGDLHDAYQRAAAEAEAAFGDGSLYVEKVITPARHVEIQVLCDHHGHFLTCGERECSIQRRHQKLIEESPSPALDDELREAMEEAAERACRHIGYRNAGTLEFLVGPDGSFAFIELNARLQVEHPVTELVTSLDLVREQVRIAAGDRLPLTGRAPRAGHAI